MDKKLKRFAESGIDVSVTLLDYSDIIDNMCISLTNGLPAGLDIIDESEDAFMRMNEAVGEDTSLMHVLFASLMLSAISLKQLSAEASNITAHIEDTGTLPPGFPE